MTTLKTLTAMLAITIAHNAQAGISLNGPELDGILVPTTEFQAMHNGPELDGIRAKRELNRVVMNGPELGEVRVGAGVTIAGAQRNEFGFQPWNPF